MLAAKKRAAEARAKKAKENEQKWKVLLDTEKRKKTRMGLALNNLRTRFKEIETYTHLMEMMKKPVDPKKISGMITFALNEKIPGE